MIRTVEAIIDEQGQVRLLESINITATSRALVTILDEEPTAQVHESALLSESALAEDWLKPEEADAWSYLQQEVSS